MALFTFMMEFKGGTYIRQVDDVSPRAACRKFAEHLDTTEIFSFGPAEKRCLIEELTDPTPAPILYTINTWCVSALIGDNVALIHFVQTER